MPFYYGDAMNSRFLHNRYRGQHGFTLIELLVSITIGLVIMIAIGAAYLNSAQTTRMREDQSELNEPARIVQRLLRKDIAQAGYIDIFDQTPSATALQGGQFFSPDAPGRSDLFVRPNNGLAANSPLGFYFTAITPIFGCDGAIAGGSNALATATPTVAPTCGTANTATHSLQVAYQAAPSGLAAANSIAQPNAATGDGRDCAQQQLPATTTNSSRFVINRYYVQANPSDGINELYCEGSGNAIPQPLARGVEEFIVRYQMAQPGTTGAAVPLTPNILPGGAQALYFSATAIAASTQSWAAVTAVETCLVSATAVTSGAAAVASLQTVRPTCGRDANGAFNPDIARAAGDNRLWKRYTQATAVRNAIFSPVN